jgi:hypothetical protein
MARLIRIPGIASLLLVRQASEIDDLLDHPLLERAFSRRGGLINRLVVSMIDRQIRFKGEVLPALRPGADAVRQQGQASLFAELDRQAAAGNWPKAPVEQMGRYVATGREEREAEAALAYAMAWPFLASAPASAEDDAYKPHGRHLWRLHRRVARANRPFSLAGRLLRLFRADRRAREAILRLVGGRLYGLHAVELTLANGREILANMRRIVEEAPRGKAPTAQQLAWAAVRTAPERVIRQIGETHASLPNVRGRVPPHTLVFLAMRSSLTPDQASGYEFASTHWSACPARRYVHGLFAAVARAAHGHRTGGRGHE